MSEGAVYRNMPDIAGVCGICESPMEWHTVTEGREFGGLVVSRVSLCIDEQCENGLLQTAERMEWEVR